MKNLASALQLDCPAGLHHASPEHNLTVTALDPAQVHGGDQNDLLKHTSSLLRHNSAYHVLIKYAEPAAEVGLAITPILQVRNWAQRVWTLSKTTGPLRGKAIHTCAVWLQSWAFNCTQSTVLHPNLKKTTNKQGKTVNSHITFRIKRICKGLPCFKESGPTSSASHLRSLSFFLFSWHSGTRQVWPFIGVSSHAIPGAWAALPRAGSAFFVL